ncbi:Protein FAR1-RELATED SEQUENCE 12 [Acorus gramineus]|uniref:Protein FAR1-RELATED SEQUENCE 12 n=1 Tax=Acorus gramineus TaxID=55184 RepID=A0AAV9BGB6_ACOGR|nr:Protein FAR1-RELATED SEQUENCE 12 [Acorus gramineus]
MNPLEPVQGMEFDSEDAARQFYNAYARCYGFRVRVSKCRRSLRDGSVVCRKLVCSRGGFYEQKEEKLPSKRHQSDLRVGCRARLVIKRQSPDKWVVTKFEKKHNHDADAPRKVDMKPCIGVRGVTGDIIRKVEHSIDDMTHIVPKIEAAAPVVSPDLELYEGMEFESEEAARSFYYAYAKCAGFTVRISKCRRARDGSIICRRFVCSKEGYYVRKYGRTKRSRALTRVGCMARLIVKKLDSGVWVVQNFEKEHNHPPFVEGRELSFQPPVHVGTGRRGRPPNSSKALANKSPPLQIKDPENSMTWRFNKLHHEAIKFAEEGSSTVDVFNVAMCALREAAETVVAVKKSLVCGVKANSDGQQDSDEVIHAASENLQLVDAAQEVNVMLPVSVQKHLLPSTPAAQGNGSVGLGRKKKIQAGEEGMGQHIMVQNFGEGESKLDGVSSQSERWNIIPSNGDFSEAQRATIQAVADAVARNGNKRHRNALQPSDLSPQSPGPSKTSTGPNPLIHAAAIAAGARIASPEVAASLIRAVQSRTAVHIKTSSPRTPMTGGGAPEPSNLHHMQTDHQSSPMRTSDGVTVAAPTSEQEAVTGFCEAVMNQSSSVTDSVRNQTMMGDVTIEGEPFGDVGHTDLMDVMSSDMGS